MWGLRRRAEVVVMCVLRRMYPLPHINKQTAEIRYVVPSIAGSQ